MKKLKLMEAGNPILRKKAKKTSVKFLNSKKGKELVKNMIHTMRETKGVGLAAPQVSEHIQLVVMEMRPSKTRPGIKHKGPIVAMNPKIVSYSKEMINGAEGCLSLKGIVGDVKRSKNITVHYTNEKGEKIIENANKYWARIFQHEIDHLNGIIYMDRVEDKKSVMTSSEYEKRMLKKKKAKSRK